MRPAIEPVSYFECLDRNIEGEFGRRCIELRKQLATEQQTAANIKCAEAMETEKDYTLAAEAFVARRASWDRKAAVNKVADALLTVGKRKAQEIKSETPQLICAGRSVFLGRCGLKLTE